MAYLYSDRAVFSVIGTDAEHFLQGLISGDMRKLASQKVIYSLMLDQKGKLSAEFFVWKVSSDHFIIELYQDTALRLQKILKFYKLRAKIEITPPENAYIYVHNQQKEGFTHDPRLNEGLYRGLFAAKQDFTLDFDYNDFRISHFLLEHEDLEIGDTPMEVGLDDLGSIAYDKGCYLGQEGANKAKRLLKIKEQMMVFTSSKPYERGSIITTEDDRQIAKVRYFYQGKGFMLVKLKYQQQLPKHIKLQTTKIND